MQREYAASITVRANSQDEADQAAIAAFWKWACEKGLRGLALGLPPPWDEHESTDSDPKIDTRFRCVDCGKDTGGGEYYTVEDDLWAASGAEDGMLCLACLERRIGRPLTEDDFTALCPTASAWKRHLAARHSTDRNSICGISPRTRLRRSDREEGSRRRSPNRLSLRF
jgi:hypothetical protein